MPVPIPRVIIEAMQIPRDLTQPRTTDIAAESARFMTRVYTWMTAGIGISGGVAYAVSESPDLMKAIFGNPILYIGLFVAQIGAVMFLSFALPKISSITATLTYLVYSVLTGVTFSVIFMVYTHSSIASIFWLTAISFGGLSTFGFVTKRDLGPIGSFCAMGLFGLVGYGLLSIFFPGMMSGVAERTYSLIGVVVFSGLTAYDTQKIKAFNTMNSEGSEAGRKAAIFGALMLYLDFVNLFMSLLRLMGRRK